MTKKSKFGWPKAKSKGKSRAGKKKKWRKRKTPPMHTTAPEGKLKLPKVEYGRVLVDMVRTDPRQDDLDTGLVSSIAESFVVSGQIEPIVVRSRNKGFDLIAGAHRLAAAKEAGVTYIEARFFNGNKNEARLLQLGENVFRKDLTVLDRAEKVTEWLDLVLVDKGLYSGQVVPKKKGRPLGELVKAARRMPLYAGMSEEARKKLLNRAIKIARLPSDVKDAAKTAKLDDNQDALLAIARAGNPAAQHDKIKELGERLEIKGPDAPEPTAAETGEGGRATTNGRVVEHSSPPTQPEDTDTPEPKDKKPADTSFQKLRDVWETYIGDQLWSYTPATVRQEFFDWLEKKPCKAVSDVVTLIKNVFAGRGKIDAKVLYAYAAKKGVRAKTLTKALDGLGYKRKKLGPEPGAPWAYLNIVKDADSFIKVVPTDVLMAPFNANEAERMAREKGKTDHNIEPDLSYFEVD